MCGGGGGGERETINYENDLSHIFFVLRYLNIGFELSENYFSIMTNRNISIFIRDIILKC